MQLDKLDAIDDLMRRIRNCNVPLDPLTARKHRHQADHQFQMSSQADFQFKTFGTLNGNKQSLLWKKDKHIKCISSITYL